MTTHPSSTPHLHGLGVALITPMAADGSIDWAGLERILAHTSPHVDYFVLHGTTGEAATTSPAEKKQVLDFVASHNPYQRPLVYGLGGNNTAALINDIHTQVDERISALLSVTPYYSLPSQQGLYQHYQALAKASTCPIILYNIPHRTGVHLSWDTLMRLGDLPQIIGIKDASSNLLLATQIAVHLPHWHLISGVDMLTAAMLGVGGCGVISVLANSHPQHMQAILRAAQQQKPDAAAKLCIGLNGLDALLYKEGNPVGIKQLLALMDLCGPQVRLPLAQASFALAKELQLALDKLHPGAVG